jgi:glycosyltransferase involved in cell wall biosynthesis
VNVVQVNYAYAGHIGDPAALLDAYDTLTGWSEALAGAGATVTVVQAFHCDAALSRNGIRYVFCADRAAAGDRQRSRWWPRAFEDQVVAAGPDLVHVNSLEFAAEVWRLRRALPPATAIVVQDHAGGVPGSVSRFLKRRLLSAADAFLFTALEQAQPWRSAGLIADDQSVHQVLESSTTLRPMDRETARMLARAEGRPALLWVGRLNTIKDPLTVLQGFERALESLPDAVLTMVYGDAELLPAVRRKVNGSRALTQSVRLVGRVPHDQLAAYYSAADLFVLGSAHESSGFALIEACACGVPPVVSNIAPFRAITADGSIGALWSAGDAADFTRALIDVAHRNLAEERRRVLAHFERGLSWSVVGRNALAAYEDVRAHRRT